MQTGNDLKRMKLNGNDELDAKASEVVKLRFVSHPDDIAVSPKYPVVFCHQVFSDERIGGFDAGQLSITITFSDLALDAFVQIETNQSSYAKSSTGGILAALSKALPDGFETSWDAYEPKLQQNKKFTIPGKRVHSYSLHGKHYEIYRMVGTDEGAVEYHKKAEKIALWYIETADAIDISDERWEIFYCFEETDACSFTFVGYFTIFGFRNPMKGISLRICQALLLPHRQRQGHGFEMMKYIYNYATERSACFEITVEDPSNSFKMLRTYFDAYICRETNVLCVLLESSGFNLLKLSEVEEYSLKTKLIASQLETAYEILKLEKLKPDDEEAMRKYRIMIKKRLFAENKNDLSGDVELRKRELQQQYDILMNECYWPIVKKLRHGSPIKD